MKFKRKVLIDLDAILDTRLGTIRLLYPEFAEEIVSNPRYLNRLNDTMSKVDKRINDADYYFAYEKRGISVLDNSRVCNNISYIRKMIESLYHLSLSNPVLKDVQVVLNLAPYQLDEELANYIGAGVSAALGLDDVVELTYLKSSEIKLDYLEDNEFFFYITYDINRWMMNVLPDVKADSLEEIGLRRYENLLVTGANLIFDESKYDEAVKAIRDTGLSREPQDFFSMICNLLFETDILPIFYYTEYNEELFSKVMNEEKKSTSPIDIEVDLVGNYWTLLRNKYGDKYHIDRILESIDNSVLSIKENIGKEGEESEIKTRIGLAELRFYTDSLSHFIPTYPAEDFEAVVDSKMSEFDVSRENSEISEDYYNESKGIPCRRYIRTVPELGREAYILMVREDCVDYDGNEHKEDELLPSTFAIKPVLMKTQESKMKIFKEEIKE